MKSLEDLLELMMEAGNAGAFKNFNIKDFLENGSLEKD